MKRLLRGRSKSRTRETNVLAPQKSADNVAPLYARFAASASSDKLTNDGARVMSPPGRGATPGTRARPTSNTSGARLNVNVDKPLPLPVGTPGSERAPSIHPSSSSTELHAPPFEPGLQSPPMRPTLSTSTDGRPPPISRDPSGESRSRSHERMHSPTTPTSSRAPHNPSSSTINTFASSSHSHTSPVPHSSSRTSLSQTRHGGAAPRQAGRTSPNGTAFTLPQFQVQTRSPPPAPATQHQRGNPSEFTITEANAMNPYGAHAAANTLDDRPPPSGLRPHASRRGSQAPPRLSSLNSPQARPPQEHMQRQQTASPPQPQPQAQYYPRPSQEFMHRPPSGPSPPQQVPYNPRSSQEYTQRQPAAPQAPYNPRPSQEYAQRPPQPSSPPQGAYNPRPSQEFVHGQPHPASPPQEHMQRQQTTSPPQAQYHARPSEEFMQRPSPPSVPSLPQQVPHNPRPSQEYAQRQSAAPQAPYNPRPSQEYAQRPPQPSSPPQGAYDPRPSQEFAHRQPQPASPPDDPRRSQEYNPWQPQPQSHPPPRPRPSLDQPHPSMPQQYAHAPSHDPRAPPPERLSYAQPQPRPQSQYSQHSASRPQSQYAPQSPPQLPAPQPHSILPSHAWNPTHAPSPDTHPAPPSAHPQTRLRKRDSHASKPAAAPPSPTHDGRPKLQKRHSKQQPAGAPKGTDEWEAALFARAGLESPASYYEPSETDAKGKANLRKRESAAPRPHSVAEDGGAQMHGSGASSKPAGKRNKLHRKNTNTGEPAPALPVLAEQRDLSAFRNANPTIPPENARRGHSILPSDPPENSYSAPPVNPYSAPPPQWQQQLQGLQPGQFVQTSPYSELVPGRPRIFAGEEPQQRSPDVAFERGRSPVVQRGPDPRGQREPDPRGQRETDPRGHREPDPRGQGQHQGQGPGHGYGAPNGYAGGEREVHRELRGPPASSGYPDANRELRGPPRPPNTATEFGVAGSSTPQSSARSRQTIRDVDREDGRARSVFDNKALLNALEVPGPSASPAPSYRTVDFTNYPLLAHVAEPVLLGTLLRNLAFADFQALAATSKAIREEIAARRELREEALERFLGIVGYERWDHEWGPEGLPLSFEDINAYMRGVSMPTHQYRTYADGCLRAPRDTMLIRRQMQASNRSYTRLVLRLRLQAEALAQTYPEDAPSPQGGGPPTAFPKRLGQARRQFSRSSSRAPSPTDSHVHSQQGHDAPRQVRSPSVGARRPSVAAPFLDANGYSNSSGPGPAQFRSPLYRANRAPLLRVFVPSPEGEWLSDTSVLECEQELQAVANFMRVGDVVWDTAAGDELNVGRLIWDGAYLLDLDYTYSRTGDVPKYLHSLAFPPSYFHRVIRMPPAGNPIVYLDIGPWAGEIMSSVKLLQDRARTNVDAGQRHMVVRWLHRARFTLAPQRAQIAGTSLEVDPGWYGVVVVEAEGTNEGLADLQARCAWGGGKREEQRVFRILREKSRPGEIWIRTVGAKERIM